MTTPEPPATLIRRAAEKLRAVAAPMLTVHNGCRAPDWDVCTEGFSDPITYIDGVVRMPLGSSLLDIPDDGALPAFIGAMSPAVAIALATVMISQSALVEMGHFADPRRVGEFTALARAVLGETEG